MILGSHHGTCRATIGQFSTWASWSLIAKFIVIYFTISFLLQRAGSQLCLKFRVILWYSELTGSRHGGRSNGWWVSSNSWCARKCLTRNALIGVSRSMLFYEDQGLPQHSENLFAWVVLPNYGRFLWRIPLWSGVCAPNALPEPLLSTTDRTDELKQRWSLNPTEQF